MTRDSRCSGRQRQWQLIAVLVPALALLSAASGCGTSALKTTATKPCPSLVFSHRVGPISIGETASRVRYELGLGKVENGGCVLMDESNNCQPSSGTFFSDYRTAGGHIRVGFYKSRVVDIETDSPHYKTADGIGVGTHIAYANPKLMDGEKFRYLTPYCGCWWGRSEAVPRYPNGAKPGSAALERWLEAASREVSTILTVNKGKVTYIYLGRGDVNYQF